MSKCFGTPHWRPIQDPWRCSRCALQLAFRHGELVLSPFSRLIAQRKVHGHRYDRFWCMDTFKEQQQLTDLYNSGHAPWEVWKHATYETTAP